MSKKTVYTITNKKSNIKIILISSLIGFSAGVISVLYRLLISVAENTSLSIYAFIRENTILIPLLFIILCASGLAMGYIIKRFPLTSGSGIPQVKGQIMGFIQNNWLSTLIVKFFAGAMAVLSGLSLGREGPSIQLGASAGQGVAHYFAHTETEKRIYMTSGASAGLAAAFNAPMAGVMFALEEIYRYFSPMVLLSTLVAAGVGDFVSKLWLGLNPIFHFDVSNSIPIQYYWLFIILGILLGVSGVLYNLSIVYSQKVYAYLKKYCKHYAVIIPFLIAGIIGLTLPVALGGGHHIIHILNMETSFLFLCFIFIIKFLFSIISFGSGTPGGIFFPLLVLGATLGAIFAQCIIPLLGLDEILFYNFVVLAMAAYFSAIVRAPLTGVILLMEMTGSFSQLLPLIITSTIAYIVAEQLNNKPIYESLLENLLHNQGIHEPSQGKHKVLIETIVHFGAYADQKPIKDLNIDSECLIVSIQRGEHEITPNGNTTIQANDFITSLCDANHEVRVRENLIHLFEFE